MGRGTKDTWPPMASLCCSCLRLLVPAFLLNMGTWTSTCERTLRGWVRRRCIANATFCCLIGNNVDRGSHFTGWQLIRLLQVFESVATQWVFTTVSLANLLWLFLLGSCPVRCLLCCPLDGETQIWLGDLRLAFCFWWFVFWLWWFASLHATTCVHVEVFLNSFFSCKDRALERDRPYQREKCVCVCYVAFGVVWLFSVFLQWNRDGGWTMYRSHTSSLL